MKSYPLQQSLTITVIVRNVCGMEQAQTLRLAQDPARVLRKRVQAGLAQNQLAARVGISAAQLCRIEKGKSGASAPLLSRLAAEFGCEVADLMTPEPDSGANHESAAA